MNGGDMELAGEGVRSFPAESTPKALDYFWDGHSLPFDEACKHFIAVGSTGSGKTITLKLLMESVFRKLKDDDVKRRVAVYDAKTDLISFITSLVPLDQVVILNPLDARFSPWNMAADISTETDAYEFASVLIPRREGETSPYFGDTARNLIAGVIKRFNASAPGQWTFRHLVLACETTERLQTLLDHEETRYLLEHFTIENNRNFAGVKSTVDNTMALYRPIAALFASATAPSISLKLWLEEPGKVLVFGNHEAAREATDTLNRLIFRQLAKFIIGREGLIKEDQTWIFLDELREAGALSGLRQLLLRGRSKGVAVAMGFQDVEGIYAVYGEHEGAEIIGAAQNAVILHINPTAPKTAQWASSVFGSRRVVVPTASFSTGANLSIGSGMHPEVIPNRLPIQFTSLRLPSPAVGLRYFAFTNTRGYTEDHYGWDFLITDGPLNPEREMSTEPDFKEHERGKLLPWNQQDWDLFDPERASRSASASRQTALGRLLESVGRGIGS